MGASRECGDLSVNTLVLFQLLHFERQRVLLVVSLRSSVGNASYSIRVRNRSWPVRLRPTALSPDGFRNEARMVETCATAELAPGSVVPDLIEANLRERDGVFDAVRNTLGSVSGRSRDVIAVLPDAAVRVVLLDFETLPANRDEAESVVRFRLKKSLPFDVDKAKVSYHAQPSNDRSASDGGGGAHQRHRRLRIGIPRGRVQSGNRVCLPCWRRWARPTPTALPWS